MGAAWLERLQSLRKADVEVPRYQVEGLLREAPQASYRPVARTRTAALMVARVCGKPGCPELKPCPLHMPPPGWNDRPSKRNAARPSDAMEIRARVRQRDEGVCYWCGGPGARHVDHVLAIADGGTWDESNMAVMHEACHDEKTRIEAARRPARANQNE